jgi:hypothetical protein
MGVQEQQREHELKQRKPQQSRERTKFWKRDKAVAVCICLSHSFLKRLDIRLNRLRHLLQHDRSVVRLVE